MEIITVLELRMAAAAVRGQANRCLRSDDARRGWAIAEKLEGLADQLVNYRLDGITVAPEFGTVGGAV